MKPSNKAAFAAALLVLSLGLGGCVSAQSTAFAVGERRLPPRPAGAQVQLFRDALPARSYTVVAKLNVHIEKTFFLPSAFPEALPQLENLARQHGADGLIDVVEKKSRLNETFIYNVTATAIAFTD